MMDFINSTIRSFAVGQLRHKALGIPAATLAHHAGARQVSRKISSLCGYVPSVVEVEIPENLAPHGRFGMNAAGGLDPVARTLQWSAEEFAYERPLPHLFAALSRESRLVLDIGAFTGFYSMIAATCAPKAEIYAFEPQPEPRRLLVANLKRNHLLNRVQIIAKALSDRPGTGQLFVPTTKSGLIESANSLNPHPDATPRDLIEVPLIDVDSFLVERKAGPVDLIKIDVESHEPQVLRGAHRVLHEDRPMIFLEILDRCDTAALEKIRREADYTVGTLIPEGIRLEGMVTHAHDSHDHILFPREKSDLVARAVERAGVRLFAENPETSSSGSNSL